LGLDLRADSLLWVDLVQRRDGQTGLSGWGRLNLPEAVSEGAAAPSDAMARVLKSWAQGSALGGRTVAMGLPTAHVLLRRARFHLVSGGLGAEELAAYVEGEAAAWAPFALEDLALDYAVLGPATLGVRAAPAGSTRAAAPAASMAVSLFGAAANRFLNLEISALEADGRGKVVSSPRIVTADQVQAHIKQGFRIPYRGHSTPLSTSPQVQFQEASLKLTVTPQITPEGHVILSVMVNKDSLGALTPDGREINTKEVKTKVLVENGGTVVIGGIYEQEEADTRVQVPVLGRLPLLGPLFRTVGRDTRRTELLVFLTPQVLVSAPAGAR
jgi:hypothetical protein